MKHKKLVNSSKYKIICSCGLNQDESEALNRIAYVEGHLKGKNVSLSSVMRAAIAEYIDNHINEYNKKMMEIFDV